jgi:Mn-dependent DtxR family transcriptional regulator
MAAITSDRASGIWLDNNTYRRHDGVIWKTLGGAELLGLDHGSVHGWGDNPCRYLGRPIETMRVPPRSGQLTRWDEVVVYRLSDLREILRKMRKPPRVLYRDENGDWLTATQLRRKYRLGPGWGIQYWANKPSKLRPGEMAIESKKVANLLSSHGPATVRVYCERHLRDVLKGMEGDRPTQLGPPDVRARIRKAVEKEAAEWLSALLASGPKLSRDVTAQARARRIPEPVLQRARALVRVERRLGKPRGPVWWCLPGHRPPVPAQMSKARAAVLSLLRTHGPRTTKQIASALKKGLPGTKAHLRQLRNEGTIEGCRETPHAPWFWKLPGQQVPGAADFLPDGMARAMKLLRERGPLTPSQAATLLGKSRGATKELLRGMRREGLVTSSCGAYTVAAKGRLPGDDGHGADGGGPERSGPRGTHPGGRRRSKDVEEVQRFCYEGYVGGNKLAVIHERTKQEFGARAPKHVNHVYTYAKRYADAKGLPLKRKPRLP